ncbi:MAG: hypothetical protein JO129_01890, partial [Candidatus Dependentiae bacterium]|nr:hypothetical protein [Candidatus Dependentiae bacterium]
VMATPVNSNLHGLRVILSQPSHRVVPVVAPDIENGRNQNEVEVDRNQQELIDDQEAWRDILTCNLSPNEGYYLLIGTTLTLGFFAAVGSVIAETSQ